MNGITAGGTDYSIWVVECGTVREFPIGGIYGGRYNAGVTELPFGYVALRGEGHVVLVDTGYRYIGRAREMADAVPVLGWRSPAELLPAIGLTPEEVDSIFLTHAHWDHAGNLEAFPNATFYLQARELAEWRRVLSGPARHGWLLSAIDPADIDAISALQETGRLRLLHGAVADVLPGIDVVAAHETHTPGHQVIAIRTAGGRYVAAGDCVMAFGNLEADGAAYTPIGSVFGSNLRLFELYDRILDLVDGDVTRVIPVHDQGCWSRYPSFERLGLHVAEVHLRTGDGRAATRLGPVGDA
jgi:N-acyl homoserine lactone hydrolase